MTVLTGSLGAQQDTTAVPDSALVLDSLQAEQDQHPQDIEPDRGFFVVNADSSLTLQIAGSIRLSGIHDFNGLQNRNEFKIYDIPVGATNTDQARFYMDARQTRLKIDVTGETPLGEAELLVEGDFYGVGNAFRLRHAYGRAGRFLLGQTWTTFSDISAEPLTVDFEGTPSSLAARTAMIRYRTTAGSRFLLRFAIETPTVDVTLLDSAEVAFQAYPDLLAQVRAVGQAWHVQLAGVLRSMNYRDTASAIRTNTGWGAVLSGRKRFGGRNTALFQAVIGEGIARYISAIAGRGLDLVPDPTTQTLVPLLVGGGYVAYGRVWADTWSSYFTLGYTGVATKPFQPDDAFRHGDYLSGNVFWDPVPSVRIGVELLFGRRENKDGQNGSATRLQFMTYLTF